MPQYELPRRRSEPLKDVLARVLREDQIKQQAKLVDVDRVWSVALAELAPDLVDQAFIRGLRRGVLHVGVRSSAALCELKGFRERALLDRLKDELPRRAIRRLKLTVLPQWQDDDEKPTDQAD